MATDHKALLIIDMLNDYLQEGAPREVPAGRWIVENILGEIRYAREKGRPVIYLCDRHNPDDPEFEVRPPHAIAGTEGAKVIAAIAPQAGEHGRSLGVGAAAVRGPLHERANRGPCHPQGQLLGVLPHRLGRSLG